MRGGFLFNREVREGASAGDSMKVELGLDIARRDVEVSEPLATAIDRDSVTRAGCEALAYTHR